MTQQELQTLIQTYDPAQARLMSDQQIQALDAHFRENPQDPHAQALQATLAGDYSHYDRLPPLLQDYAATRQIRALQETYGAELRGRGMEQYVDQNFMDINTNRGLQLASGMIYGVNAYSTSILNNAVNYLGIISTNRGIQPMAVAPEELQQPFSASQTQQIRFMMDRVRKETSPIFAKNYDDALGGDTGAFDRLPSPLKRQVASQAYHQIMADVDQSLPISGEKVSQIESLLRRYPQMAPEVAAYHRGDAPENVSSLWRNYMAGLAIQRMERVGQLTPDDTDRLDILMSQEHMLLIHGLKLHHNQDPNSRLGQCYTRMQELGLAQLEGLKAAYDPAAPDYRSRELLRNLGQMGQPADPDYQAAQRGDLQAFTHLHPLLRDHLARERYRSLQPNADTPLDGLAADPMFRHGLRIRLQQGDEQAQAIYARMQEVSNAWFQQTMAEYATRGLPMDRGMINRLDQHFLDCPLDHEAFNRAAAGDFSQLDQVPPLLRDYLGMKALYDHLDTYGPDADPLTAQRALEGHARDPLFRLGLNYARQPGNPLAETAQAMDSHLNRFTLHNTLTMPEGSAILNAEGAMNRTDGEALTRQTHAQQAYMAKMLLLAQLGRFDVNQDGRTRAYQGNIADALAHGGRIHFILPPGPNQQELQAQIMGDTRAMGMRSSRSGPHGVAQQRLDTVGEISRPGQELAGGSGAFSGARHYQMDIALGGLGAEGPNGPAVPNGNHGQLYALYAQGSGRTCGAMLLGIRPTGPNSTLSADATGFFTDDRGPGDPVGGRTVDLSGLSCQDLTELLEEFEAGYLRLMRDSLPSSASQDRAISARAVSLLDQVNQALSGQLMGPSDLNRLVREVIRDPRAQDQRMPNTGIMVQNARQGNNRRPHPDALPDAPVAPKIPVPPLTDENLQAFHGQLSGFFRERNLVTDVPQVGNRLRIFRYGDERTIDRIDAVALPKDLSTEKARQQTQDLHQALQEGRLYYLGANGPKQLIPKPSGITHGDMSRTDPLVPKPVRQTPPPTMEEIFPKPQAPAMPKHPGFGARLASILTFGLYNGQWKQYRQAQQALPERMQEYHRQLQAWQTRVEGVRLGKGSPQDMAAYDQAMERYRMTLTNERALNESRQHDYKFQKTSQDHYNRLGPLVYNAMTRDGKAFAEADLRGANLLKAQDRERELAQHMNMPGKRVLDIMGPTLNQGQWIREEKLQFTKNFDFSPYALGNSGFSDQEAAYLGLACMGKRILEMKPFQDFGQGVHIGESCFNYYNNLFYAPRGNQPFSEGVHDAARQDVGRLLAGNDPAAMGKALGMGIEFATKAMRNESPGQPQDPMGFAFMEGAMLLKGMLKLADDHPELARHMNLDPQLLQEAKGAVAMGDLMVAREQAEIRLLRANGENKPMAPAEKAQCLQVILQCQTAQMALQNRIDQFLVDDPSALQAIVYSEEHKEEMNESGVDREHRERQRNADGVLETSEEFLNRVPPVVAEYNRITMIASHNIINQPPTQSQLLLAMNYGKNPIPSPRMADSPTFQRLLSMEEGELVKALRGSSQPKALKDIQQEILDKDPNRRSSVSGPEHSLGQNAPRIPGNP